MNKLLERFVAGTPARTAALLVGVIGSKRQISTIECALYLRKDRRGSC